MERRRGVLWLLVGQCSALAPLTRPVAIMHRSPNIRLALQTDDQEYASQQDEISALKAKLRPFFLAQSSHTHERTCSSLLASSKHAAVAAAVAAVAA